MILTIAIIVPNVIGFVYVWRRVAYALAWDFGSPDMTDRIAGIFFGFFPACVWPVTLAVLVVARGDWFFLPPPDKRRAIKEREQADRINALERRNAQLERELGVGA